MHKPKYSSALIVLRIIFKRSASDDVLEKLTQTCKLQEKATDAEVAAWNNGLKPEPTIVKCLNACAGETLGMVSRYVADFEFLTVIS